jgi:hypothetical protein
MLVLARAIVLREQDIAIRERDVARRKRELEERVAELDVQRRELQQLRLNFSAVASPGASTPATVESEVAAEFVSSMHPPLAKASSTVAHRVLAALEMEPRPFSPSDLFNFLELPPPIETLRTTLSKMYNAGLIARPFPGLYCALQHEAAVRNLRSGVR